MRMIIDNKKGQLGGLLVILIIIGIIIGLILLWNVSYQHGSSRDIVQGYDSGIIWHHVYLKNDHTTAYCFDDERFIDMLEQSQKTQKEVIVTYEKYVVRGSLCTAGDKFETVIIKNMEWA